MNDLTIRGEPKPDRQDPYPYVLGIFFAAVCLLIAASLHWHIVPRLCQWVKGIGL